MASTREQRTYDHRLRDLVRATGDAAGERITRFHQARLLDLPLDVSPYPC